MIKKRIQLEVVVSDQIVRVIPDQVLDALARTGHKRTSFITDCGSLWIDLKVYDSHKLSTIHAAVLKILNLPLSSLEKAGTKYGYFSPNYKQLEQTRTFAELKEFGFGNKIYMEFATQSGKKRTRKDHDKSMRKNAKLETEICMQNYISDEKIEVVCSTRIFDCQMVPLKRVRVVVHENSTCQDMMTDVMALWRRTGLKFKCGKTVLDGHKTFRELGINNNSEIVVTGGYMNR